MDGNLGQVVGNNGLNPMLQVKNGIITDVRNKLTDTTGVAHVILQLKPDGLGQSRSNETTGLVTDTSSVEGVSTIGGSRRGTGVFAQHTQGSVSTITNHDIFGSVHLSIHAAGKFSKNNAKYVDGMSEAISALDIDATTLAKSVVVVSYAGIGNAWQSKDRKNWSRDNYKEDELIRKFSAGLNDRIVRENAYNFSTFKIQLEAFTDFLISYGGVIGGAQVIKFFVPSVSRRFNAGAGVITIFPSTGSAEKDRAAVAPIINSWLAQPADPYMRFIEGQVDIETSYSNM